MCDEWTVQDLIDLGRDHGCMTGDCPHQEANACLGEVIIYAGALSDALRDQHGQIKTLSDGVNRRLGQSTNELPLVTVDRASEIVAWAGAMLTALNVGDVASGSPLHLKLREVMVAFWHK